jgi:hypothetical protein
MIRDEVAKMEAGPEMDTFVAENVMGWRLVTDKNGWRHWVDEKGYHKAGIYPDNATYFEDDEDINLINWHPSWSMLWAWEVVEKAEIIGIIIAQSIDGTKCWMAHCDDLSIAYAETAPLAICRSALLSVFK